MRLEFELDDATFTALREELVGVLAAATDEAGVLVATTPVVAHPAAEAAAAGPTAPPAAGSSPITVLLCDLVASPQLDRLGPDARNFITARTHAICDEVARRLRGHVQPWISDGVAIFFGHPRVHEDDALRAVRCGWEILRTLEAARNVVEREFGVRMSVRIGIATGLAGDGVDAANAFGDTPRTAGRVQELAEPDRVTVDAATQARALAHFTFDPAGELFAVSAPLGDGWRSPYASAPLVGRSGERALLQALAERAASGTRSAVLLRGVAGSGKSRLVEALRESATSDAGMQAIECQCSPSHRGSALHPLLEGLRRHWQLDGPEASARLAERTRRAGGDDHAVMLLADMLGVARPDGLVAVAAMSPQRRRRDELAAVAEVLAGEARRTPLVLVVEDLHWVDPTTLELVDALLDGARELPLMIVLTARAEFVAPQNTSLQRIELGRLQTDELLRLVGLVAAEGALPDGIPKELAVRAAGSPLLAEELTRTVLATQDSGSALAATLYGCLMARLDRDSTARSVARLAATIGREFDVSLLEAVGGIERSALDWGLERLVHEHVVAAAGPGSYAFRHSLLQDAARSSLRREPLREHNLRIARALLASFPHVAEAEPERVARHFEYAGELEESVRHWRRAGVHALRQSALHEAAGCFERGLELTSRLADGPERRATELGLRVLAGSARASIRSWSAPAAVAHYTRADVLSTMVDATPALVRPLLGLAAYRAVSGRVEDALALARKQIAVAEEAGNTELLLEAECETGSALLQLGRHRDALTHLDRVVELYDPGAHHPHAWRFGRNPAAITLAHRGLALACRDDREGARSAFAAAADVLRAHRHPFSQAWVHCAAAAAAFVCDEREVVLRESAMAIDVARAEGFDGWLAAGSALHGWARVCGGEHDEGLAELRSGIAAWTATGAAILRPFLHGLLADGLARADQPDLGRYAIDQALGWVQQGERWSEPELLRIRAELLLGVGDRAGALGSIQSCVSLARRSGAPGLERRAAATLSRLGGGASSGAKRTQTVAPPS